MTAWACGPSACTLSGARASVEWPYALLPSVADWRSPTRFSQWRLQWLDVRWVGHLDIGILMLAMDIGRLR